MANKKIAFLRTCTFQAIFIQIMRGHVFQSAHQMNAFPRSFQCLGIDSEPKTSHFLMPSPSANIMPRDACMIVNDTPEIGQFFGVDGFKTNSKLLSL